MKGVEITIVPIGNLITRKKKKCGLEKAEVYSVTKEKGFVLSDSLHDFSIYSEDTSNYSIVNKNDFAYNPSRLNIGSFALFDKEIGKISPMYVVFSCDTEKISPMYLYYYIKSPKILNVIDSLKEVGARFRFDFTKWGKIQIPLPHIKVQEEIVKILDSFTNLIDALNEELSLRQKQFEYYREKLLTFDDNVEKSIVTEVAQLKSGLTYKPSDVSDKGILVLRSSNIKNGFLSYDDNVFVKESTNISDRSIVRCNDILICVRNGSKKLVGKCAMIDKNADGMAFGAFMSVLRAKDINPKYLFYVWSSQIIQDKIKGDDAAPINQITSKDFNRLLIPVPKEQIQKSIVEKLDAFESLISSLKEEITLRQKQYEYYREKLLTFD